MIILQCELELPKTNKELLLTLMRKFSSCMRYAYKRLLEGKVRKDLKKELQTIFGINSRYVDDAIVKAQSVINLCKEKNQNPIKVIFGGRKLFNQLKKKHLTGKRRKKLKQKWKEKRLLLYSRGDKTKCGNLNLRLIKENDNWYLRINTGNRQWIKAKVIRSVKREKDKWIDFMWRLTEAEQTGNWFPYSVEIKVKEGKFYAYISYEEHIPEVKYTKENGIIGIDINASPFHIALANVSKDGNLVDYQSISLHELIGKNKNQREYLLWQVAHQIMNYAEENKKAIAIERLKGISRGYRGDGKAKLRKRFQQWSYRSLLKKIKTLGQRKGIQVIEVNPAYTSIIGALKYCPNYLIDKDTAGAFVVGRRALGFKEDIPENYLRLLSDRDYMFYSIVKLEEKRQELKARLKEEANIYKKKAIKQELNKLNKDIEIIKKHLQSLESESGTQEQVNQWKEPVRGVLQGTQKAWQVLKVALGIPILGKSFSRDFSPLRPVLVLGDWDRVSRRLAPVPGAGAMVSQNTASRSLANLKKAVTNRPARSCSVLDSF